MRMTPPHLGIEGADAPEVAVYVSGGDKTVAGGHGLGPVVDEGEDQRHSGTSGDVTGTGAPLTHAAQGRFGSDSQPDAVSRSEHADDGGHPAPAPLGRVDGDSAQTAKQRPERASEERVLAEPVCSHSVLRSCGQQGRKVPIGSVRGHDQHVLWVGRELDTAAPTRQTQGGPRDPTEHGAQHGSVEHCPTGWFLGAAVGHGGCQRIAGLRIRLNLGQRGRLCDDPRQRGVTGGG